MALLQRAYGQFTRIITGSRGSLIREVAPTAVPVFEVGKERSDVNRILWGLTSFVTNVVGEFCSASMVSNRDVSIEQLWFGSLNPSNIPNGQICGFFTPPASYVPFLTLQNTLASGMRPKLSFDGGGTVVRTGTNPAAPPFIGFQDWNEQRASTATTTLRKVEFSPPGLILPATMFLTVSCATMNTRLLVNWLYREI